MSSSDAIPPSYSIETVRIRTKESGLVEAFVDQGQPAGNRFGDDRDMTDGVQTITDVVEIFLGDSPGRELAIGEGERERVGSESPFRLGVEVALEVAHDELAEVLVDGRSITQAREVRLGDRSEAPALAVE